MAQVVHRGLFSHSVWIAMVLFLVLSMLFVPPQVTRAVNAETTTSASIAHNVILVVMENKNYSTIETDSKFAAYLTYIRALSNDKVSGVTSGSITDYYGVQYPSTPNYIVLTSGSNQGYTNTKDLNPDQWNVTSSANSIFRQLPNGKSAVFAENEPTHCDLSNSGTGNSEYVVHHTAMSYYLSSSKQYCLGTPQYDASMGTISKGNFVGNLTKGTLPSFSMVIGDICDDMHTCSGSNPGLAELEAGDNFTKGLVKDFVSSTYYKNSVMIILWDTGNCLDGYGTCKDMTHGGGHVPYIAISGESSFTLIGAKSVTVAGQSGYVTHYNAADTFDELLGLPLLDTSTTGFASSLFATSQSSSKLAIDGPATNATKGKGTTTSLTISLSTKNSSDVMVVYAVSGNTAETMSIKDTSALSWSVRKSYVATKFATMYEFYSVSSHPLSSDKITVTQTKLDTLAIIGFGVSGADTSSPFVSNSGLPAIGRGWGTVPSVKVSTSHAYDLIFGFLAASGEPTISAASGFTLILTQRGTYPSASSEYKVVSSIQTNLSVNFKLGSNETWVAIGDAIKP